MRCAILLCGLLVLAKGVPAQELSRPGTKQGFVSTPDGAKIH
jgi:hypothetical protein